MRVQLASAAIALATLATANALAPARIARADPLVIDLSDSDPSGIESLPGILESEAAALALVAGPGRGDLEERLAATGIPRERLRDWAPYLGLPGPAHGADSWMVHAVARGSASAAFASQVRARIDRGDLCGACTYDYRSASAHPSFAGWVEQSTRFARLTAGAIGCGVWGGDPWEDPLAHRGPRSTTVLAPELDARERVGARGFLIERDGAGATIWRDPADGRGIAVSNGGAAGTMIAGGFCERGGWGSAIRLSAGRSLLRCEIHVPRGLPPALVIETAARQRSRGRVRMVWSLGSREDGLQARAEGTASGRVAALRWSASASVLAPVRRGRPASQGGIVASRAIGGFFASASTSWNRRASGSARIERSFPQSNGTILQFAGLGSFGGSNAGRASPVLRITAAVLRGPLRFECGAPLLGSRPSGAIATSGVSWRLGVEQSGSRAYRGPQGG